MKRNNSKYRFILIILIVFIYSCSNEKEVISDNRQFIYEKDSSDYPLLNDYTFRIFKTSEDPTYGYTKRNPIKVGGIIENKGPLNQSRYLNALRGPNGEKVSYIRQGSCCKFESENGHLAGDGYLDIFEVSRKGAEDIVILYLNMYEYSEVEAPLGFMFKVIPD